MFKKIIQKLTLVYKSLELSGKESIIIFSCKATL